MRLQSTLPRLMALRKRNNPYDSLTTILKKEKEQERKRWLSKKLILASILWECKKMIMSQEKDQEI